MRNWPISVRIFIALAPFLSAFFFPYTLTFALALIAGLIFPPLAFAVGVLLDLLYYADGWLFGTIAGFVLMVLAHGVRQFVRTRIM